MTKLLHCLAVVPLFLFSGKLANGIGGDAGARPLQLQGATAWSPITPIPDGISTGAGAAIGVALQRRSTLDPAVRSVSHTVSLGYREHFFS